MMLQDALKDARAAGILGFGLVVVLSLASWQGKTCRNLRDGKGAGGASVLQGLDGNESHCVYGM